MSQFFTFYSIHASRGFGQSKLNFRQKEISEVELGDQKKVAIFFFYSLITLSVVSYNHVFLLHVTWNQELVFQNFAK